MDLMSLQPQKKKKPEDNCNTHNKELKSEGKNDLLILSHLFSVNTYMCSCVHRFSVRSQFSLEYTLSLSLHSILEPSSSKCGL